METQKFTVVRRVCYWDAGTKTRKTYLRLRTNGEMVWEDHKPHASRFTLPEAACLMRLAPGDVSHEQASCENYTPSYEIVAF